MAYKFIVAGSVQMGPDGRSSILLEPAEREFVLKQMRGLVASLQSITEALARDDMKAVAKSARAMGMADAGDAPAALVGKLPLAFKTQGFGMHRDFDRIAADAESQGGRQHALAQLAAVLNRCVACHAAYRIEAAPAGR
ncbi:MAG: hypothetical protein KGI35_06675 [Burkholderiales bacterium]|nr:hypothetical protein [Burkholderiales bacterium]